MEDFWERIERVMGRLDGDRTPDRSFDSFLKGQPGRPRTVAGIARWPGSSSRDFTPPIRHGSASARWPRAAAPATTSGRSASAASSTATTLSSSGSVDRSPIASASRRSPPACGGSRDRCRRVAPSRWTRPADDHRARRCRRCPAWRAEGDSGRDGRDRVRSGYSCQTADSRTHRHGLGRSNRAAIRRGVLGIRLVCPEDPESGARHAELSANPGRGFSHLVDRLSAQSADPRRVARRTVRGSDIPTRVRGDRGAGDCIDWTAIRDQRGTGTRRWSRRRGCTIGSTIPSLAARTAIRP